MPNNQTYFTSNVGGGARWFPVRHWGVRGDYRYIMIHNSTAAPVFFAQQTDRHANRGYGSLVLTF